MENYIANLTSDIAENNKKLLVENKALNEEVLKLKEHIKVLEKNEYVEELEANLKTLQDTLESERIAKQNLKDDVESLSKRLDEFLALFASYINEEDADIYHLHGDKSLMFGVNIDSSFLHNADLRAIRNYLHILKCTQIQQFTIYDFKTQKRSDITLIGEVFADYIRLSNLTHDSSVYGLVEISMPDILNQSAISLTFYGNKDVSEEFVKFKKIYSRELNLSESLES